MGGFGLLKDRQVFAPGNTRASLVVKTDAAVYYFVRLVFGFETRCCVKIGYETGQWLASVCHKFALNGHLADLMAKVLQ